VLRLRKHCRFLGGEYDSQYDAFQEFALADVHTTAMVGFILGGFEEYPDTRIDPRQSDI
jgi:hypothetical protein